MIRKAQGIVVDIKKFVCEFNDRCGCSPTIQEIADGVGLSKATAYRYVMKTREDGVFNTAGRRSITSANIKAQSIDVPVLSTIPCGIPKFAEENIEEYVSLPASLFGQGDFFILRAFGDSMIGAKIDDGDLVLIRKQDYAKEGQIVVALINNEATLKRFYPKPSMHIVKLHPENSSMNDIFVHDCEIQGVAVKVLKDLYLS